MQLLVGAKHPRRFVAGAHFLVEGVVQRLEMRDHVRADAPRRLLDRHALERQPDVQDLQHAVLAHQRHADGAVRQHLQRAFGGEPLHRLAHRHQAGAERVLQLPERDLLARLNPADHEVVAQLVVDALAERAALDRLQSGQGRVLEVHSIRVTLATGVTLDIGNGHR